MAMGSWRKPHAEGHHQVGHWTRSSSSSSYSRKPPLDVWKPTVPSWEKTFCSKVGSVPWRKVVEAKKYLYLYDNVMKWDDSAGKEAFDNAKTRFWAKTNDLPCDISLPDPDIYIDEVDWNSSVDPELILELERAATVPAEEEKKEDLAIVFIGDYLRLDPSYSCTPTGWGDAEAAESQKNTDLVPDAQINLQENDQVGLLEQNRAPDNAAEQHEWRNFRSDPWGWNRRNYRGGGGWNRKTWYGYNRRGEGMSWYKAPADHRGDEFQASRGRWNYRGGRRRGSYDFDRPRTNNMPNAW